jgi:endonuclease YncB( thermonuclease family)
MIKIYTTLLIVLFTISCQVAPVQQEQPSSTNSIAINSENEFSGKVVGIADGDTATILDESNTQHKIRFIGIDAPEKAQAFGHKSKQNLSDLIFGKTVTVQVSKRDKYNREVAKILLDGKDINLQQIKDGFAWHYKDYQREQSVDDRKLYASTEEEARRAKRGLWFDEYLQTPSDFRKSVKLKQSEKDKTKIFAP